MNWTNILTIYLKELKDSLRDRRTLLSTIIIPTLVMPLLTFGVGTVASGVIGKARSETLEIRSLNNARAARARKGKAADLGFKPQSILRVE